MLYYLLPILHLRSTSSLPPLCSLVLVTLPIIFIFMKKIQSLIQSPVNSYYTINSPQQELLLSPHYYQSGGGFPSKAYHHSPYP